MSHSSRTKNDLPKSTASIANIRKEIGSQSPFSVLSRVEPALPGTMNDGAMVRIVIAESMRNCGLSRELIAERMSELTGTTVTPNMLNGFAAESRNDVRFPCELIRAFCTAVSDTRLLSCFSELSGLTFVDQTGLDLMELGRQYLLEKRAAAKLHGLETRLEGVTL